MKRTVTMLARETKGDYVKPEFFDSKQTRLKPLKAGQSQFYISYGGKKYGVGNDPLLAMDAKARQEKIYRDIEGGLADAVVIAPKVKVEISPAIAAYIAKISQPDKNNEFRPIKIINSKNNELQRFLVWSKKLYMKEIDAELMRNWRDHLLKNGSAATTVSNKLMIVTTFCKENPLEPMSAPLPMDDFPDRRETTPDPYTEKEFDDMLEIADYEAGLLIYTYASTGLRKQELANAEKEDIDFSLGGSARLGLFLRVSLLTKSGKV